MSSPFVSCLSLPVQDYSAGTSGPLISYRWEGALGENSGYPITRDFLAAMNRN